MSDDLERSKGFKQAREWLRGRWCQEWPNEAHCQMLTDYAEALQARVVEAEHRIRRINAAMAIKGGDEHHPTMWAYEQACAALDRHKARADDAEAKLATARDDALEEAAKVVEPIGWGVAAAIRVMKGTTK